MTGTSNSKTLSYFKFHYKVPSVRYFGILIAKILKENKVVGETLMEIKFHQILLLIVLIYIKFNIIIFNIILM